MDQRDILRRLCNGALAQLLSSNNTVETSSNPDSLINTLIINAVGHLMLKRKTNRSTQTDFNVQRINQNGSSMNQTLVETQHLLPLYKLQHFPRNNKNCIR